MRLSCDFYLAEQLPNMACSQISGLYWLCCNLGPYWDSSIITKAENRLIELLRIEIATQKKFDSDYDADIPEGLQTMSLTDILLIEKYYQNDSGLQNCSRNQRELLNLIS